jgi:MFS transporter, DHA1 family, inner membrane transport protein
MQDFSSIDPHMKFFNNSHINRLYVHSGLQSFAFNGGAVFSYVYLLKAGIAVHLVFLIISAVILLRLLLRLTLLPIVHRIGLRNGLILGTLIEASSFLLLGQVQGLGGWLYAYMLFSSCGTAFYWTCYHASVTRLGDTEHRGAQVSAREAIFAVTGIVGPLFGGFMLTVFGPAYAFASTTLIYALAAIPMLGAPPMAIEPEAKLSRAARNFAGGLAFSDGLVAAAVNFGWRIVLFQTLGESFQNYGSALAVAGVVGAVMGLVGGRLVDLGHHKRSVQISLAFMVCTVLAMALGYATPWMAIAANMIGAVAGPIYMSSIMPPLYNVGQNSACAFRYNVVAENGFDCGAGFGALLAALLVWSGFGYTWLMLIGLAGCLGIHLMLRNKDKYGLPITV